MGLWCLVWAGRKQNWQKVPEMYSEQEEFEIGLVTGVRGSDALVRLNLQPACATCGARILCVPDSSGNRIIRAANPLHAGVGSKVAISEQSGFLLKLSLLQYGIPLAGFLAGIFLMYTLEIDIDSLPAELIMFAGGIIGLFLGAVFSRLTAGKLAGSGETFFEIVRIL